MADRRGLFVPLLVISIFFLSSQPRFSAPEFQLLPRLNDAISEEQRWLGLVGNSSYGDLLETKDIDRGYGLNVTGFEAGRDFAWDALPKIKQGVRERLKYALGSWTDAALDGGHPGPCPAELYNNVTGHVEGRWVRSKLQEGVVIPQLNLSSYTLESPFGPRPTRLFESNFTGGAGDVSINFKERALVHNDAWDAADAGRLPSNISEMNVQMELWDDDTGDEQEMLLRGVYFLDLGQAVLTTTSTKFAGIFVLPYLTLSEHTFNLSRTVLNESISKVIQRQIIHDIDSLNPWTADTMGMDEPNYPEKCDLVLWLQQLPPTTPAAYAPGILSSLETELSSPTGKFLPEAPELHFSMLAFSPDCGYVIESKGPPDHVPQDGNHLVGLKTEVLHNRARKHLMVYTLVLASQLALLIRQMREADTPSTRSRVSFFTIASMAMGDSFSVMWFWFMTLFMDGLWLPLLGVAFLTFMNALFFGMQFLSNIWAVQAPERRRREREEYEAAANRLRDARQHLALATAELAQARNDSGITQGAVNPPPATLGVTSVDIQADAPQAAQDPAEVAPTTLPLPVTAPRPTDTGATPVFMPSDQQGLLPIAEVTRAPGTNLPESRVPAFSTVYVRFCVMLMVLLFLSLNAIAWPASARHVFFTILGFVYLGFWVPQIYRNTVRNCRRALNWGFVVGHSLLRLVPFVYLFAYEKNVFDSERHYVSLAILACWVWMQVVVLASQEIVGPRWFVRSDWVPPAYDYHPILRADEEGSTLPLGMSEASGPSIPSSPIMEHRPSISSPTLGRRASIAKETKERGKRVFDCAVCMQDLEVPVVEAGASGGEGAGGLSSGLMLARRQYMVTPCRHIFHTACLEGWMRHRLQCPNCREELPPL